MTKAYSYACRECEGMETCPASIVSESRDELWRHMELHALLAHQEDAEKWDVQTRTYLDTLIREVEVNIAL